MVLIPLLLDTTTYFNMPTQFIGPLLAISTSVSDILTLPIFRIQSNYLHLALICARRIGTYLVPNKGSTTTNRKLDPLVCVAAPMKPHVIWKDTHGLFCFPCNHSAGIFRHP